MDTLTNLNLRQMLEGMPLIFNPDAAEGLDATIQFDVTGDESGIYHLAIAGGECTFHIGPATSPTLTITTPSDVWLAVSNGEIAGQDALMQGQYQASGDLSLLLKMDSLFGTVSDATFEAPRAQRPPGPFPLSGMAWMTVAFIPWMILWITFDIPGVSRWISIGLPLLLSALIVGYRLVFSRPSSQSSDSSLTQPPTLFEWGGLGFFAVASVLILIGSAWFDVWGSVVGTIVMGGLWLGSLVFSQTPLSADYSKWAFVKALWRNSMFLYPNAIISLMWGWQFILSGLLGIAAIVVPEYDTPFTIARYLLLIPAFIFTSTYQKRVLQLKVDDYEATFARIRLWAGIGLVVLIGITLVTALLNA